MKPIIINQDIYIDQLLDSLKSPDPVLKQEQDETESEFESAMDWLYSWVSPKKKRKIITL